MILSNLGPASGESSDVQDARDQVKRDYNSQKTSRSHSLRKLDLGDCIGHRARGGGALGCAASSGRVEAWPRRGRCCRRGPEHASGAEDGGSSGSCSRDPSRAEAEEPPALTSLWLRCAQRSVCEAPRVGQGRQRRVRAALRSDPAAALPRLRREPAPGLRVLLLSGPPASSGGRRRRCSRSSRTGG